MQTTYPISHPAPKANRKIVLRLVFALPIVALTLAAISLLLSPIGQRWMADQRSVPPAIGVTEIKLIGAASLNHIFAPAVTQIKAGETITWHFNEVDEDGQPVEHNVVFEGSASPVQATGTYSLTFDEPGTYNYTCTLHAYMDGAVIVTE